MSRGGEGKGMMTKLDSSMMCECVCVEAVQKHLQDMRICLLSYTIVIIII